ncbi:DNA adenine methylase [Polyangium jinanense]|uniref:Site-specific DNA-methyltransferase (adenine-specific) n=1 Tax=Polyangium jinanense TaxID=2829994 RepID=A0A9X3XHB9_9BACT|nr:DNA adenine methylase [Polyangium jinanense]MDC3962646.1 DNA adenine methylase [Polyangium jinanense]MDC3989083.1 DNA adenine methylase [Polyangium jinanense]
MLERAIRTLPTPAPVPLPSARPGPLKARGKPRPDIREIEPGTAKPFIKWVGGKRQLLHELDPRIPSRFNTYHEPFVGGGALFFHLMPERAELSDTNERLVRTYIGVRDAVEDVIDLLASYPHDRDFFMKLRSSDIDTKTDVEVAAWFIYLNRTGFNGLYRVNRQNQYNVPFGDYQNPTICDAENLRACSRALKHASIRVASFEDVAARARPGDFVYFDPPYVPLSASSSFTSYTSGGFGMREQQRLRDVARELKERGVRVLLSNSSAPEVYSLYGDGFELAAVGASRAINCKAAGRGRIQELIIR